MHIFRFILAILIFMQKFPLNLFQNPPNFPQIFLSYSSSVECCLGFASESPRVALPTKIAALSEKKIVDVACGDRFTVVLASELSEHLPRIYPRSGFSDKSLSNIRSRAREIRDVLLVRKAARNEDIDCEELYENMTREEGSLEEALAEREKGAQNKAKKGRSSHRQREIARSVHVGDNDKRKFIDTSKNLLNDAILSRKHKKQGNSLHASNFEMMDRSAAPKDENNESTCMIFNITLSSSAPSLVEVLSRIRRFEKDFVVREVEASGGKVYSAQQVYDRVCQKIVFKEKKDYSSIPLTNVMDPVEYSEEWDPQFAEKKSLLADLDDVLTDKNPAMKKEYIEKVRNDKENEIMGYVMSGTQSLPSSLFPILRKT